MITTKCKEMGEESIDRSHPIFDHQLNDKNFCIRCGKFNPLIGDACISVPEGLDSGTTYEFEQLTDKHQPQTERNHDN